MKWQHQGSRRHAAGRFTDVYNATHGNCAELCAKEKGISREDQDALPSKATSEQRTLGTLGNLRTRWFPSLCLRGEEMTSWWIAMRNIAM